MCIRDRFVKRLNRLGIPKVEFQAEPAVKCGITGTHMTVKVDGKEEVSADHHEEAYHHEHTHEEHGHEHHHGEHGHEEGHSHEEHHHEHSHEGGHSHGHHHEHHNMQSITAIVGNLDIPEEVKKDILAVYDLIAPVSYTHLDVYKRQVEVASAYSIKPPVL